MRGLFVTFEGVEGSGKTTVAKAIAENLRQKGLTVTVTAEPGIHRLEDKFDNCWQQSMKGPHGPKLSSSSLTEPNMWRR